jgi:hypothetical protein
MLKLGRPKKGEIRKPARPFENYTRDYRMEYEGKVWFIDLKAFYKPDKIVVRVYRVNGDVTTPLLHDALDQECVSLGTAQNMSVHMETNL